jgi:ATP-binding cassette subfamily F protein 3
MPLLTASGLTVSFGELEIFSDISLEVPERARIGMVGPNGGGKTTLLRVLVEETEATSGNVHRSSGLRIGYVPQTTGALSGGTITDEILLAFSGLIDIEDSLASSATDVERATEEERRGAERRYAQLLERYEALGGYDYHSRLERVADGIGLDEKTLKLQASSASGGELTRAALARALLAEPDLLVLDEPTNYLDFKGIAWLEDYLEKSRRAFVVVSHDRYFLDRVAGQLWELERGRLRTYRGNYTFYRTQRAERAERQAKEHERQQEFIAKEQVFIDRFKAGQRSRQAKDREKKLAKLERIDAPQTREHGMHVTSVKAKRTPRVVVDMRDLKVGFVVDGQANELLSIPKMQLGRESRTAVIGSNGAGKSTLVKTILSEVSPLAGSINIGAGVEVGYHRQGAEDLPSSGTVLEAMQQIRNIPPADERNYLARFLFQGDDVFKEMSALSGGERTRLAIARLLTKSPSLLVLDEPTTHLDIPSREALEEVLSEYDGTLLFVSHDRRLISLLAKQLIIVEDGGARLFAGSFDEWASEDEATPEKIAPIAQLQPTKRRVGSTRNKHKVARRRELAKGLDQEKVISSLEERLAKLEVDLQTASESQAVDEVARLGKEHDTTRDDLERAWGEWGG